MLAMTLDALLRCHAVRRQRAMMPPPIRRAAQRYVTTRCYFFRYYDLRRCCRRLCCYATVAILLLMLRCRYAPFSLLPPPAAVTVRHELPAAALRARAGADMAVRLYR